MYYKMIVNLKQNGMIQKILKVQGIECQRDQNILAESNVDMLNL